MQAVPHILTLERKPTQQPILGDRLIWTLSRRGTYTTKEGYEYLRKTRVVAQIYVVIKVTAWKHLRGWKQVIPRVQVFIWRAIHDGLPTLMELHKRISNINPKCPRCGEENKYLVHMFFLCNGSRATWFASPLALRVDEIPLQFTEALMQITNGLQPNQIAIVCNLLWCIWLARNEEVFSSKKTNPEAIIQRVRGMVVTDTSHGRIYQKRVKRV